MDRQAPLVQARRHVDRARIIVEKQRRIIARPREARRDSSDAEELLDQFERSLRIFEEDLRRTSQQQMPLCPACGLPMTFVRRIPPDGGNALEVHRCQRCGVTYTAAPPDAQDDA